MTCPEEMSDAALLKEVEALEQKKMLFYTDRQRILYLRRLVNRAEALSLPNLLTRIEKLKIEERV